MRFQSRWIWIGGLALIIVVLDQWTKSLVEAGVPLNSSYAPIPSLAQYFNIVHWQNTGAAFGMLRGLGSIFIIVALVIIAAVVIYARSLPSVSIPVRLCLGLQLGGALGNLIDRIFQSGHVTDYLLFMLPVGGKVYQWPAFNVADASIVCGTIALGVLLLLADRAEAKQEAASSGS